MLKLNSILLLMGMLAACKGNSKKNSNLPDTLTSLPNKTIVLKLDTSTGKKISTKTADELVYQDDTFATYSDSQKRGTGVISFDLDINDRLEIYNDDGSFFGRIVLNEDQTYYTLDMPQKTVARKVVPQFDAAAFVFDADEVNSDDDYLKIYVNGQLRKVKKAGIKYSYMKWDDYLRDNAKGSGAY
ncbi:hypothetical protein [Pedobacter rhodius]|uniref:Uncharacterized protein n=1 Tax=Pedobacter rhodius TaxID=3004098 RepID=A0ABT4KVG2_9SPHI|nr:hypothetical protein [Pedobacter sp. SJ11]MCZ4222911.1 hypothetical protein [Pedobacter sp. SJ11]